MRKYLWIAVIALIASAVYFTSCERIPKEMMDTIMPDADKVEETTEPTEMPPEMMEEMMEMPIDLVDVLIYTNRSYWITLEDVEMAAETTKNLVESEGFSVEITKDPAHVAGWMLQTTGDGNVNVIILYGVLPDSVYGAGNTQPDGSIAENWIETMDGDTILNHADYIAWNSDFEVGEVTGIVRTEDVGVNQEGGLQNLMDNPNISLRYNRDVMSQKTMIVTSDGMALAPSLVDFESYRSVQLDQLQGEWFAEKIFASDTGDAEAACADPVILRDGDRGRIAIIHGTFEHAGLLNGEVAAEIIINSLLAPLMMATVESVEPPEPTEMPEEMMEPEPEPEMSKVGDVLIYNGSSGWIFTENATIQAEITRDLLLSAGLRVEISDSEENVSDWMLQKTADGKVDVLILYGSMPSTIYAAENAEPDGSIAENWIETTDGDTILNHADYIAFISDLYLDPDVNVVRNELGGLRNLMDNSSINLYIDNNQTPPFGKSSSMIVTSDGTELTPSLTGFDSYRPMPLNQLAGAWFAEKVFASDTGDAQATYADPVIVRDGDRGRLAIVHGSPHLPQESADYPSGEVAAEIIINYLLAE